MGKDPSQIREEVEQTRAQMGETLEAVAERADVKGRAKESVTGKVEAAKGKVTQSASRTESKARHGANRLSNAAQENPLGVTIGGIAMGFVAGLVIPSTKVEEAKLGPAGEELRDQARKTGNEALERGKQVAQEAAHSAAETAKEQGYQQGQELAGQARESAKQVSSKMGS